MTSCVIFVGFLGQMASGSRNSQATFKGDELDYNPMVVIGAEQ